MEILCPFLNGHDRSFSNWYHNPWGWLVGEWLRRRKNWLWTGSIVVFHLRREGRNRQRQESRRQTMIALRMYWWNHHRLFLSVEMSLFLIERIRQRRQRTATTAIDSRLIWRVKIRTSHNLRGGRIFGTKRTCLSSWFAIGFGRFGLLLGSWWGALSLLWEWTTGRTRGSGLLHNKHWEHHTAAFVGIYFLKTTSIGKGTVCKYISSSHLRHPSFGLKA